ncbi:EAL domain-containing protein [Blastococcus sp. TML/M2B]|nr:EAL domain-containing protein [Blastococcus sp. TML/M2B]MBN1095863.1 EAL domain-containing protein [Blastococcus sp. TML/C7B]
MVRATVALAHDLGMAVVAEGIETQHAWARVADLCCETVQGYGLARPLPVDETLPWLLSSARGVPLRTQKPRPDQLHPQAKLPTSS